MPVEPLSASRAAATLRDPPVATRPANAGFGTALLRMASRICSALAFGYADARRPTAPATWGDAIDVPPILP